VTESMRLVVISHKQTWSVPSSPSGYATTGGFPFQIKYISQLFDQTTLLVPVHRTSPPPQTTPLEGHHLCVHPLSNPSGRGVHRKIALLVWLPRHLPVLWRQIAQADAVHTPIPGDIGTIGLLVALIQRKPLFVRHCGTWGIRDTMANRLLTWLLPRIAGERNVVLATGGGPEPPCPDNPSIRWIFATTITRDEWENLPVAHPWGGRGPVHLITVSRLDPSKNTASIVHALPRIRQHYPQTVLHIVGDGPSMPHLCSLVQELDLEDSVIFHGHCNHRRVMQALGKAHLFVFPTRVKEGFPKAVLEAMACGLPVIATRVSVIPHLIGGGRGLVLESTSPEAVAQAVLTLLTDPARMARMGQNARLASRQYTLEAWRDTIGGILESAWGPLREHDEDVSV